MAEERRDLAKKAMEGDAAALASAGRGMGRGRGGVSNLPAWMKAAATEAAAAEKPPPAPAATATKKKSKPTRVLQLRNVSILEAGGGHCWFSEQFAKLGNDVLCSEGRAEHVDWVRSNLPDLRVRQDDYDNLKTSEIPHANVVLHFGLMYHLRDAAKALDELIGLGSVVVFETEVADSEDASRACSHQSRACATIRAGHAEIRTRRALAAIRPGVRAWRARGSGGGGVQAW